MRTTLTIDSDVAQKFKELTAQRKSSFKEVVNEALRQGLPLKPEAKPVKPFQVVPITLHFKAGIDPNKLNQLADELEIQEFQVRSSNRSLVRRSRNARCFAKTASGSLSAIEI